MNLSKPDYPYNQYVKNGKVDLQKIAANESTTNDHILVRLLLCVVQDLQKQIDSLKTKPNKKNKLEAEDDI